jgi:CBS domain-containing protein
MHSQRVKDVMTTNVVAVRSAASFKEIVDALAEYKVSAVPVVGEGTLVVGVVSEADLLHKLELATSDLHRRLLDRRSVRTAKAKAGGDTAETWRSRSSSARCGSSRRRSRHPSRTAA